LITDYERNKLRLYDEMIVRFAIALGVTADHILGMKKEKKTLGVANLRIVRRLKQIEKLSESRKKAILRTLDDLLLASDKKAS
jgi:Lhr-like helicase